MFRYIPHDTARPVRYCSRWHSYQRRVSTIILFARTAAARFSAATIRAFCPTRGVGSVTGCRYVGAPGNSRRTLPPDVIQPVNIALIESAIIAVDGSKVGFIFSHLLVEGFGFCRLFGVLFRPVFDR